jgi:hypothetical protein
MVETQSDTRQGSSSPDLKTKATEIGQNSQDHAIETIRSSASVVGDKIQEATEAAKIIAADAIDKLQQNAATRQASGADYLERFADHLREPSQVFAAEAPLAERGIAVAADYVEDAASGLREGSPRDLVSFVSHFARRQPAAFLGTSTLAGLAAVLERQPLLALAPLGSIVGGLLGLALPRTERETELIGDASAQTSRAKGRGRTQGRDGRTSNIARGERRRFRVNWQSTTSGTRSIESRPREAREWVV